ncbi:MAG TPA: hypothetical protein VEW67_11480 [Thermoleophilaceae bacterium]|nr:hypothetical protein [Thermoleophilaceae bacterium]
MSSVTAQLLDASGDPTQRAGTYPDRVVIEMFLDPQQGNVRDVVIDLPPGFAGDPRAIATCPRESLTFANPACPPASQVGKAIFAAGSALFSINPPIYSVEPGPDQPLMLGYNGYFNTGRFLISILPNGRSRLEVTDLSQEAAMTYLRMELWGVPADHQSAPAPRRGFLAAPANCDGPPTMDTYVKTWQAPGISQSVSTPMGAPLSGCETLGYEPRLDFALDSSRTDSPTGLQMTITIPQRDDPDGQVTARTKAISMRFPEGVAVSPGVANTATACQEEAVGLGLSGETRCAASSKIGTAVVRSPVLDGPIPGGIYLGRQVGESDYRMYVAVRGQGVDVKLAGTLHADPSTGRVRADFPDVPELPFETLTLSFQSGPRAPLATPQTCGAGSHSVILTPYGGGAPATTTAPISIGADPDGRPCPSNLPFTPDFVAGTSTTRAGAAAPLAVTIRRRPGDQQLGGFGMTLPKGMSAKLGAVPRCAAAAAVTGACPPQSRVGTAITEAGSGTAPFALEGKVFLTGPYRRAPFGMSIVFRGIAGPFDLGTIVVRSALRVDPLTGQVTVDTDPLPTIVAGVPLRIQTVALDIDRPGFMLNPTSCAPSRVSAVLRSSAHDTSRSWSRFAVGGCRKLRFRPAVATALTDSAELNEGGHPGFRLRMRSPARGANLRGLEIDLPKLLQPSPTGPTAICALTQLDKGRCPADAKIGYASARSPILSAPLRGPIYQTQPPRGAGPADAWALMRGMGVSVRFRIETEVEDGRLRGTIANLPDIPLSRLTLNFASGNRGLFTVDRDACVGDRARRMRAALRVTAYSRAARRLQQRVGAPGC